MRLALFVLTALLSTTCLSIGEQTAERPPNGQETSELSVTGEAVNNEPVTNNEDANELPIFDTHVHYNQDAWDTFSPDEIIDIMERANVLRALVSSSPDNGTRLLYEVDPDRIVPFLRPYHNRVNSSNWYKDSIVVPYLTERLETPIYQGIGEFHLHFDGSASSPIVRATTRMAVEQGLYLHIHSNAEVVRTVFDDEPQVKILWAHAGMTEPPDVISAMMDEYEHLWADISIREYNIAPDDKLDPAWRELFLKHPDRIMVGSDTWTPSRWGHYQQIISFDRNWLNQLPRDVAEKIAYGNAMRLFGAGPDQQLEP